MREEQMLGRLMAGRDGMDVQERERIFEAVFEAVTHEETPPAAGYPMAGAFALAAAALLALTLTTGAPAPRTAPGLVARGGEASPHRLEIVCTTAGRPSPCSRDALMSFRASSPQATHVALFARHDTRAAILWYSPRLEAVGSSPLPSDPEAALPVSIDLSRDHHPGRYTVYAIFSQAGLTRADIKARMGAGPDASDPDLLIRSWEMP